MHLDNPRPMKPTRSPLAVADAISSLAPRGRMLYRRGWQQRQYSLPMQTPERLLKSLALTAVTALLAASAAPAADNVPPTGFVSLFNGRDFTGWTGAAGDNGHWKIVEGVIDYDARSEAKSDKNLWSEREFGDFVLQVDWRIKETTYINH